MTVRQAATPISDQGLIDAKAQGARDRTTYQRCSPENKSGPEKHHLKCRLYPQLAFFFDGTGNNLEIDEPLQRLSNVAKLYYAAIDDVLEHESATRYIPGVGTPFKVPKHVGYTDKLGNDAGGKMGLALGAGGELRISYALAEFSRILEQEWYSSWKFMEHISVAIFGFSRGATAARAFVRRLIKTKCQRVGTSLTWLAPSGDRVPLRITFMGLFDTVASVGGPGWHLAWGAELAIPAEVQRCVHFVAGHEVRQAFPLDSVRFDLQYPANCEEVVYPGVHADVGGGYTPEDQGRSNLLSHIPLRHMLAEALRAGVPIRLPSQLTAQRQPYFLLPDDSPVVGLYQKYMAALPVTEGGNVETLIRAHRRLLYHWRGTLARQRVDTRVLGHLYGKIDPYVCGKVAASTDNNHRACPPNDWVYEVPANPIEQAKQLLGEQRRLQQRIADWRQPSKASSGKPTISNPDTAYTLWLLSAWDDTTAVPAAVDALLAEHVHDSVAHFTSWPCALYDPREIYCDKSNYLAQTRSHDRSTS